MHSAKILGVFMIAFTLAGLASVLSAQTNLEFGNVRVQEAMGSNECLDPGETLNIIIPLVNVGDTASDAGNSGLTCITAGITVNTPNAAFTAVGAGETTYLSFSVSAASSMIAGTIAVLEFSATAGAVSASKTVDIYVGMLFESFETGNLKGFPWSFNHPTRWVVDNSQSYTGLYSAKSGLIADGQATSMLSDRDLAVDGDISFRFKVSSQQNLDYFRFYIDGALMGQWSGELDWNLLTYPVTAGSRSFFWMYSKSSTGSSGSDCVWVDDIIFPASVIPLSSYIPSNLVAYPSHQSVVVEWEEPLAGFPIGYNVFRNSILLTTVSSPYFVDTAVTNGGNYSYYVKAVYFDGESDASNSYNAHPGLSVPANLTAMSGNEYVELTWNAASGRLISGYNIYRNASFLAYVIDTAYTDNTVENEITYSYYVTTVYSDPAGESAPSNTVYATPDAILPFNVNLGTGTEVTLTWLTSPINIWRKSAHGQAVYTAAELNAEGVFGPIYISSIGFYIVMSPYLPLPDFIIRMKHTTDADVQFWQTEADMATVYSNPSYMPVAGNYQMLNLDTPFLWNGVDNIVIDTAFNLVPNISSSGTVQYTETNYGYRYTSSSIDDQTHVFEDNPLYTYDVYIHKPNIRLTLQIALFEPTITCEMTPTGFVLNWNAENYATEYQIFRSESPDSPFVLVNTTTDLGYTDVTSLEKAFYYVRAVYELPARQ